jgi:hypothetical protein
MAFEKAFEIDEILLGETVGITQGSVDPSAGSGVAGPIGTIFIRTNGELYQKFGALDFEWNIKTSATITTTDIQSGVDEILDGETFTIEARRQSIVHGLISIAGTGCLIIEGTLVLLGDVI